MENTEIKVQEKTSDFNSDIKNLKVIKNLGIAGLTLGIASFIVMFGSLIFMAVNLSQENIDGNIYLATNLLSLYGGVAIFGISTILSLVGSIMILATNWKHQSLDDGKILWGILGLLLLGSIALLVFGSKKLN